MPRDPDQESSSDDPYALENIKRYEGVKFCFLSCDDFDANLVDCQYFGLAAKVTFDTSKIDVASIKRSWNNKKKRNYLNFRLFVDPFRSIRFKGHWGNAFAQDTKVKQVYLDINIEPPVEEFGNWND